MADQITPAFLELAIARLPRDLTLAERAERYRYLCGKSARLLRPGDAVAVRDLIADPTTTRTGAVVVSHVEHCEDFLEVHTTAFELNPNQRTPAIFEVDPARLVLVQTAVDAAAESTTRQAHAA